MAYPPPDLTNSLRTLMDSVKISSLRELSRRSAVPRSQLTRLRQGKITTLPLGSLQSLAMTLEVSLEHLVQTFDPEQAKPPRPQNSDRAAQSSDSEQQETKFAALKQEYERLQQQMLTQRERDRIAFQQEALQVLESLLLQLPTAAHAATKNPEAPAVRLLPLLKPIDQLLKHWNIETIGTVGDMIDFDPQAHQWMPAGIDQAPIEGDSVKVRYVGYRQGDRLLYRAKVSRP